MTEEKEEKRRLFNEEGNQRKDELSALVYAGTEFAAAAETMGLETTQHEAFKVSEAPREIDPAVLQGVKNMSEGDISPMITSGDSGVFVYVKTKAIPEIAADDEKLGQTSNFLKRYSAFVSSSALLNELVAKGLETEETLDVER